MKTESLFTRSFLVATFLLAVSAAEPAQAIEVMPLEFDFGEVAVGSSNSTVITVVNYTGHSHTITAITFSAGSSPDFSIATALDLPMTLPSLERLDVEIVFSPSSPGLSLAELQIRSVDSSLNIVTVSLQGGTGTPPSPGACAPPPVD